MLLPSQIRYRVLALLVFASFISYVLRYSLSASAPALVDDFGFTETHLGWIFAAFTFGYTLLQFPAGLWVDRVGARKALTIALVVWALLTLATALLPTADSVSLPVAIVSFMILRFLVGIAHAPMYPLTAGTTERWFPVGSWALPNGLSSAGLTVGSALTPPVLVVLIAYSGWRLSFVALSILGFVGAVFWWRTIRDFPAQHPAISAQEVALINAGREPYRPARPDSTRGWRQLIQNRDLLLLTLSYFCMNYVFYQLFNWVFYFLVEVRDLSDQNASVLTALQWIMAAIGATLGALWCDRLCRKRGMRLGCQIPAIAGLLISGVLMMVGAMAEAPLVIAMTLALCFFCHQSTEGAYWAAAINIGGSQAGAASGIMNTGGNLVGVLNALLVPWLANTFGWAVALGSGTGFALAGAVLWWFIRPERTMGETA